ncbi:hypothetical protein DM02DRAFT_668862 [Periconia macrospinosa]|uniref:Kinetochore protein fta4 n=1 Tax=Periconia macrospinosa TaxID=97972 RepID=A0A2V1E276_9PLEO|nr:hypothetical protein DM02DRAFT_668862 [Periconia macrospinosa]
MSRQGTVVEQKQHFLQLRKQYLSRGIVPSEKLKRIAQEGGVELSVLKGAMDKVNRELKQHSRTVYSRQMTQHVIEQIDKFYWASGSREIDADATTDGATAADDNSSSSDAAATAAHTLYETDDLTQDENISKIPFDWPVTAEERAQMNDQYNTGTYLSALHYMQELSARRLELQMRLNKYKTLLSLLKPYRNPMQTIQPNLVGRDAPLALELGKTRTLAIRVAGRVGERFADVEVPSTAEDDDMVMGEDPGREKVQKVLESW